VGGEPFLLLLGDHLYVSNVQGKRCAQQLIDLAKAGECAVAAVHPTREHLVGFYGTVAGRRVGNYNGVYQIEKIVEKPSLSRAELELHVPGLRAGHYLCFFGMHVLTPGIFEILERNLSQGNGDAQAQLTPALEELARSEKYLALEVAGSRYDIGTRYGLLRTQCALALGGRDRDQVLVMLADLLGEAVGRQETRAGR
jgi:UTP--glucose-1-phosphate uridylyltransferase